MSAEDVAGLCADGVECYPIRAAANHNPRLLLELARAAQRARVETVHTWLTQMDVIGGAVALAMRRHWVLSERSSPEGYGSGVKDRLRTGLGRFADVVVANSASGLAGWPDHPHCMLIANGVDFDAVDEAPPLDDPWAADASPLIVTVGRLVRSKGINRVLAAMPRLRQEFPGVRLAILGEGPERPALEALAYTLGVARHVLFTGFRRDALAWLKSASVFVSASQFEGHPNAVSEAAAAGTPQVLSDIAMHRDTVGRGGALFVEPDDARAVAAAVTALVRWPDLAGMVAAAAWSATRRLSIEQAADRYVELYWRVASAAPARRPRARTGSKAQAAAGTVSAWEPIPRGRRSRPFG